MVDRSRLGFRVKAGRVIRTEGRIVSRDTPGRVFAETISGSQHIIDVFFEKSEQETTRVFADDIIFEEGQGG